MRGGPVGVVGGSSSSRIAGSRDGPARGDAGEGSWNAAMTSLTGVDKVSGKVARVDVTIAGSICVAVTVPRLNGQTPVALNADRIVLIENVRVATR